MSTASTSVLVVDDNAANRALAQAALEDDGYRVLVANDGVEAIAIAAAERLDCVVMDIRMPKLDGIAAAERIRALPGGDRIAIVFVTAQRDVATFDRALAAGGDDFILKPYWPNNLSVSVETAIRLRRLAAERGELFGQLKHQRDQLQRLELQKEQLVAFLVHDLKNPVHAIGLHAQLAIRSADDPARVRAAAAKCADEARALMRMITNLLDISKADEGRLEPVPIAVDARELVDGVLDELAPRAADANVRLAGYIDARTLRADRDLIARVLANLVDNAIRHAPDGSEIAVRVVRAGGGVELRVADAGPGVPQDLRETVFERFRSGATSERTNRGLGLAFCKLAVEAHRGRIWIEDGNPGAVFCVRLDGD